MFLWFWSVVVVVEVVYVDVPRRFLVIPAIEAEPVAAPTAKLQLERSAEPFECLAVQAVFVKGLIPVVLCAIVNHIFVNNRPLLNLAVVVEDQPLLAVVIDAQSEQDELTAMMAESRLLSVEIQSICVLAFCRRCSVKV